MQRLVLISILFATACDDSVSASRLDHAQILAVRTEPARIAPGERARIDVLAGDDSGAVFEASPDAVTALGRTGPLVVERAADGWYVTAGATPELATIDVTLTIDDTAWRAEKSLVIGAPTANPRITAMQVDGTLHDELVAAAGTKPALTVVGEGSAPFTYAWYSSVGDLDYDRQPTAILDASAPADGTVVIVVRDSAGGVSWQLLPATVE